MKICRECGKIYKEECDFDFCPKDGKKLSPMINADLLSLLSDRSRSIEGVWKVSKSVSGADDVDLGLFSGNALDVSYFVKNYMFDSGDYLIHLEPVEVKKVEPRQKVGTVQIDLQLNYNKLKIEVDFVISRSNIDSIYSILLEGQRVNFNLDPNNCMTVSPMD